MSRIGLLLLAGMIPRAAATDLEVKVGVAAEAMTPMTHILGMLKRLVVEIAEEAVEEEKLYHGFMCYCDTNRPIFDEGIEKAKIKLPQLYTKIEKTIERKSEIDAGLTLVRSEVERFAKSQFAATAQRTGEQAVFDKSRKCLREDIDALTEALTAVKDGLDMSFIQGAKGMALQSFVVERAQMSDAHRNKLMSFLSTKPSEKPTSSEIIGILKFLLDDAQTILAELEAQEAKDRKAYDELAAANDARVVALKKEKEDYLRELGPTALLLARMEQDYGDLKAKLELDERCRAELIDACIKKPQEWTNRQIMRAEETRAISEVIEILEGGMVKIQVVVNTAASFAQLGTSTQKRARAEALELVRSVPKSGRPSLQFIEDALMNKKGGLEQISNMIEILVQKLKDDEKLDTDKKAYCERCIAARKNELNQITSHSGDMDKNIAAQQEVVEGLELDEQEIRDELTSLDKTAEEVQTQRKEESAAYRNAFYNLNGAIDVLKQAASRMKEFVKDSSSSSASLVQVSETMKERGMPDGFEKFQANTEEQGEVIRMIEKIASTLDAELNIATSMEQASQRAYEDFMPDLTEKREAAVRTLAVKNAALNQEKLTLERLILEKEQYMFDLQACEDALNAAHGSCDWLFRNFEERKAAREVEIQALRKAQAVLHGADFTFLQLSSKRLRMKK